MFDPDILQRFNSELLKVESIGYLYGFWKTFLAICFIEKATSSVIFLTLLCKDAGILSSCSNMGATVVLAIIAAKAPFFPLLSYLVLIVWSFPLDSAVSFRDK